MTEEFADEEDVSTSALPVNDDTIVSELEDRREAYARHFRLSDSSKAAVICSIRIHEQDASGEWVEIDNTLMLTEDGSGAKTYVQQGPSSAAVFLPRKPAAFTVLRTLTTPYRDDLRERCLL